MTTPYHCYTGNSDAQFKGQEFVVNPAKVFGNSEDFSLGSWPDTLSNQGMLRVHPECSYGPSGIQGTISMANPPGEGDKYADMWEASKGSGEWDYYGMLGFIQIPHPDEYIFQVFFIHGSFFENSHELICTITIEFPEEPFDVDGSSSYESLLQAEWTHIYRELFVKKFGAVPLAGHKWATCPCDECSSPTSKGICSTPTPI